MLFNSLTFMAFFPIVAILYYLIPHRLRHIWLLLASYYFYMCWNAKYALLMLFSTAVTYLSGRLIAACSEHFKDATAATRGKKLCVAASFILNLGVLFFFKYFDFAFNSLNSLMNLAHIELNRPTFDVLLPVGISFYTFQALGYTVDVYREDIQAEKSFLKYALFVSFFPQLVAGPIERSGNLLGQFNEKHRFEVKVVRDGLLLMLWGLFLKMVIADRVSILVDQVYGNWKQYGGVEIILATVLFAVQIYCDFNSYSTIAVGAAKVMGFRLMENFRQPYFATSVKDFWQRWHISLTGWFRDYLYIPLGGNRKGTLRKYVNLMTVFLVSGLWHGADWHFVAWGGLNGLYQIAGDVTRPCRKKVLSLFRVKQDCFSYRLMQRVITFVLIDISWLFFRADGLTIGLRMIKQVLLKFNPSALVDGSLFNLGITDKQFTVVFIAIGIMWAVDMYRQNGSVRQWLDQQNTLFRWGVYYALIFGIIIFGVYGLGYNAASFIYFQF